MSIVTVVAFNLCQRCSENTCHFWQNMPFVAKLMSMEAVAGDAAEMSTD